MGERNDLTSRLIVEFVVAEGLHTLLSNPTLGGKGGPHGLAFIGFAFATGVYAGDHFFEDPVVFVVALFEVTAPA
jgi:hypothetical protein